MFCSLLTGPNGKVFGLDITDAMIEKARANINKMNVKNAKIIKGDATKIPLDDQGVDVVTSKWSSESSTR
jgi:ubiquinone/menaquinone biosynthesis C-methylase UbiE